MKSFVLCSVILCWSVVGLAGVNLFSWSWSASKKSSLELCSGCYDTIEANEGGAYYKQQVQNGLYGLTSTPVNKLPVINLLKNHLANISSTTTWQFQLAAFSNLVDAPTLFKSAAENSRCSEFLKMGPKTSFYFYLGLLSMLRDVALEDVVDERPEVHMALSKAYRNWSKSGMCLTVAQSKSMTDDQTIRLQIVEHHREYFELLIWRFLASNNDFDGWGERYRVNPKDEDLTSYEDSWNRVSAELAAYRRAYSGGADPDSIPFSVLMANMRRLGVKYAPKAEEIRARIPFDISTEVVISNPTVDDSEKSHLLVRQRRK